MNLSGDSGTSREVIPSDRDRPDPADIFQSEDVAEVRTKEKGAYHDDLAVALDRGQP